MIGRVFTPAARGALYGLWAASGPLLVAYGVSLPGGKDTWDQVVFIVLGIGNIGTGALAIKHLAPAPAAPEPTKGAAADPAPQGEAAGRGSLDALRQLLDSDRTAGP